MIKKKKIKKQETKKNNHKMGRNLKKKKEQQVKIGSKKKATLQTTINCQNNKTIVENSLFQCKRQHCEEKRQQIEEQEGSHD